LNFEEACLDRRADGRVESSVSEEGYDDRGERGKVDKRGDSSIIPAVFKDVAKKSSLSEDLPAKQASLSDR
jgi:hypothetical protein